VTDHVLPGMVLRDHTFTLPLDHDDPGGEKIEVFAREVVAPHKDDQDLPWLLFLQGGPGFRSPRPPSGAPWLSLALEEYRVLLLDQRGTGRSGPIAARTLAAFNAEEQARRLALYRADSIVADCEAIRDELTAGNTWTVLGQSFGGFCCVHYLSVAPDGLAGVMIAGGLPPLSAHPDTVYRATFAECRSKNERYYERYPEDVGPIRAIHDHLTANEVRLPSGDPLTPERFQTIGLGFGTIGAFETVHYLVEDAFVDGPDGSELSYRFLAGVEDASAFPVSPLYAVLHESIYCQGTSSDWSAERVRSEFPEFAADRADGPALFTGEMVFPWMFDQFGQLRPLKDAADRLAAREDWPGLYDPEVLAQNEVPVSATIYYNDMYIARDLAIETGQAVRGAKVWITNEFEHDGIRTSPDRVFGRLRTLLSGDV